VNSKLTTLIQQGMALHQQGQFEGAKVIYEQVLKIQPNNFDGLYLLGLLLAQNNQWIKAADFLSKALQVNPDHGVCHSNLGNVLKAMGCIEEALEHYNQAISINPNYAEGHYNLSVTLQGLGRVEEALEHYNQAISLNPNYIEAYSNRGNVLQALGRKEEALVSYDQAIGLKPDYPEFYSNKANVLQALGRMEEALLSYDLAISIKPDYAEAFSNRGIALQALGRMEEALLSYDLAISIKPDYAEAFSNRGIALQEVKRLEEALVSYDHAIRIKPDYAEAHWNLALCNLLAGNFNDGLQGYEWRWKNEKIHKPNEVRKFSEPLWLGAESIKDKTILLYAEQGLGDTIQFCRYVSLVAELGAKVVLEVQPPLARLFKSFEGVSQIVIQGEPPPAFDYRCPLMSLPLAFNTQIDSIPNKIPYIQPPLAKIERWKIKLGAKEGLRVGLVWSGGFRPNQSELWGVNKRRNIPLEKISKINLSSINFYSLQKGEPAESELLESCNKHWKKGNFYNFTGELNDFSDTAALIANLDLIISVDTSTAHLAAAMGKPVWLLNRFDTCWRWMLNRNDSPWYPSVRVYRQEKWGDWDEVLERVNADLLLIKNSQQHDFSS